MKTTNETTVQHTPGPWKILADPILGARHPFHEARWITTEQTDVGITEDMKSWELTEGTIICQMRDGPSANARLIAAAPDLLAVVTGLVEWANNNRSVNLNGANKALGDAIAAARATIAKAKGL